MATRYVEFVRNIYNSVVSGHGLEKCKQLAEAAGYRYMNFNGAIWYLTTNQGWIELSCLSISDFEC